MNSYLRTVVVACALTFLAVGNGFGQQNSDTGGASLGDVARALRAQKSKDAKPARVITNDNLSPREAVPPPASAGSKDAKDKNPVVDSSSKDQAKPAAGAHDEAYFRKQMGTLQDNLDTHQRELSVLQQKLGQNQVQYYSDPNQALQQQYSREDIDKLTAKIDAKKQQIADDQKAMEDLRDQLRQDGGDPGWLR